MRKTRKYLCLLMACLLVTIQQAGFAHALTHLGSPAQKSSRGDQPHPAEKVCTECVAYAQIGSALTGSVAAEPTPAPHIVIAQPALRSFSPEFIPAFYSQGPPAAA